MASKMYLEVFENKMRHFFSFFINIIQYIFAKGYWVKQNLKNWYNQIGFTLIELMIALAVVGILASIAVPTYQDYIARAQMSEAVALADGLKTAVSESYAQDGVCPSNTTAAVGGIALSANITGSYVLSVVTGGTGSATGGCSIVATMKSSGVSTGVVSKTLTLTMTTAVEGGSSNWVCTSNAMQKYLPKVCAGI
jgi:type IV pilus assembly protein PilA